MVPFAHAEWLAANIPGAQAHLAEGEGHLSLFASMPTILDDLLATSPACAEPEAQSGGLTRLGMNSSSTPIASASTRMPMNTRCTPVASVAAVGWSPATRVDHRAEDRDADARADRAGEHVGRGGDPALAPGDARLGRRPARARRPGPSRSRSAGSRAPTCHSDPAGSPAASSRDAGHGERRRRAAPVAAEADAQVEPPGQRRGDRPAERQRGEREAAHDRRRRRSRPARASGRRTQPDQHPPTQQRERARGHAAAGCANTHSGSTGSATTPLDEHERRPASTRRRRRSPMLCQAVHAQDWPPSSSAEHDQRGSRR